MQLIGNINEGQKKLWLLIFSKDFLYLFKDDFSISIEQLKNELTLSDLRDENLNENLLLLTTCSIKWQDNNSYFASPLLSYCEIIGDICIYDYSDILKEKLENVCFREEIKLLMNEGFKNNSEKNLNIEELFQIQLKEIHKNQEIEYAKNFLKQNTQLFDELVNIELTNIKALIFRNALYGDEQINALAIIESLLPFLRNYPEYSFYSFEEYINKNLITH